MLVNPWHKLVDNAYLEQLLAPLEEANQIDPAHFKKLIFYEFMLDKS
jgi:hypothetical protein